MSVGLAHDYLLVMRGAERTFAAIADLAPDAPVYTLLYDEQATERRFYSHPVVTSPLQRLPLRQRGFRALLPIFPSAAARLPAERHRLVVSSSSAFAHGVRTAEDAVHVCYCHTPFRYAWFERERALAEAPRAVRPMLDRTLRGIRDRDREIATRVTRYVANSRLCQERIGRFWGREAAVVHPPVAVERFSVGEPEDFFLVVGEVVRHKRQHVALEAAKKAGRRVIVVGEGPDLARLAGEYAGIHEFAGRLSDEELAALYSRALGLIVPNVEEFGIAAVEAQAAGRPVIGVDRGGLQETVIDGETGLLVREDDVEELAEALADTDFTRFDSAKAKANAQHFSTGAFQRSFAGLVRDAQGLPGDPGLSLT